MWNILIILTLFRVVHCGIVSNSAVAHSSSIGGQESNYVSVTNSKGPDAYSGEGNYISISSSSDPNAANYGGSNYVSSGTYTSNGGGANYISYSGNGGGAASAGSNSIALSNLQDAQAPNYVSLDLSNIQGQISNGAPSSSSSYSSSSSDTTSSEPHLATGESIDGTASLTINSPSSPVKSPCTQRIEEELGTNNAAEANSGSSATATLEVNPIVVRHGCGVEFSSPPIRVDRPAIRFGYDEIPPPGPYHTPNCGCTPKGSCHGEVGLYTRQVVHRSDLVCGLRFEACCYDGPYPGVADEFVRAAACIPQEECIRPYGILPTDVRDYGVIAPCPGQGAVRCLIVDAQGLLEFKAALAEIQIKSNPQPEAEVHIDSDSAQVTPVHIDIPITNTAAEVAATAFTSTAVDTVTPEEPAPAPAPEPEPLPTPVEVKVQPPAPAPVAKEPCEDVRVVPASTANANSNSVASTTSTINIPQVFYPTPTVVQFPAAVGSIHDYVHNFDSRNRVIVHPARIQVQVSDANANAKVVDCSGCSSASTFTSSSSSGTDANSVVRDNVAAAVSDSNSDANSQTSVSTFTSTSSGTESNSVAAPVSTSASVLQSGAFQPVRPGVFYGSQGLGYGGRYGSSIAFRKPYGLRGYGGYYDYGFGKGK